MTLFTVAPLLPSRLEAARSILARACTFAGAAVVAEEKLFGPAPLPSLPLGADDESGTLVGVAVVSGRWLRVLAVDPRARRRGAGSALLAACERAGASRAGDQPGNYLTPGIDAEDLETLGFFTRRGWREVARNENLVVTLRGNERVTAARAVALVGRAADAGYSVRRVTPEEAAALAASFSAAWSFEAAHARVVHGAWKEGRLVAFACLDANNRGLGGFGPAGTLPEHRRAGLGEALLVACLVDAAAAGHDEATIAWIGPRRFYERACAARPGGTFVVLAKDVTS